MTNRPVGGTTEVHQFHSGTAAGDAITNEMLAWQIHLQQLGYRSEIYAQHIPDALSGAIHDIQSYSPQPGAVLLLHHSMGHDILDQVLAHHHRVVPVFHNITPLEFIDEPFYRKYARIGQQQLRQLAKVASGAIADSNLNRREMLRAGFRDATVIPVKTDFSALEVSGPIRSRSADWLFVGRVVPSKGQLALVDAFADALAVLDIGQRLVLIGDASDAIYVDQIEAQAARRGITDRLVTCGKVSDADLAASYQSAGLFVSMSLHEGFGVPLLEAMAAGVPVVAYDNSAVGETMGGAGFAIAAHDQATFVHACVALQSDADLSHRTVQQQHARIKRIEHFDVAQALLGVLHEAAGAPRRTSVQIQGPFETAYSLAILNRELALALDSNPAYDVSLHATEGPGDYVPSAHDLARVPAASALYAKSTVVTNPDVVIRQMYPPRVNDSNGATTFQYFGWEESVLPAEYVSEFNQHLTGIGTMSSFVKDVLLQSGVTVPVDVVGVGVRRPDTEHAPQLPELGAVRSHRFLHISSAFPRKGVDLLVRAFFDQFTDDDDVTLVLKTFPNPHNQVAELLAASINQHTNPPQVVWIDRDMTEPEIDALYAVASTYVHPARGEGFGLPVAEAMAAGVPVIAPASTGLADFVNDDTAFTVPFETAVARSHLSVPGSMWTEPNLEALGVAMRSVFASPDDAATARRVENARELMSDRYSWAAVAERFTALIERERAQQTAPSIAMVTTWNSRCGIAEYSANLVTIADSRWDTQIYADRCDEIIDPKREEFVTRTWISDPRSPIDQLVARLDESGAEVIHVQHNFGFIGLSQLGGLVTREVGERAVVVTLHRTEDLDTPQMQARLGDVADALALADRVIVHQAEDADRLRALGIDRVEIVPIGARQFPSISLEAARIRLGIDLSTDSAIIATYGFLLPHKGTLQLIQAIDIMRRQGRNVGLMAVCALHTDPVSAAYERECRAEIDRLGLHGSVRLITDFLAPEVSHLLLSTADVIALPYQDSAESSSAALRFVLPVGRAVVASEIGIFHDARESLLLVEAPPTSAGLALSLGHLIDDPLALDEYAAKARHLAHQSSIDNSVAQHTRIYREVVNQRAKSDKGTR